MGQRQTLHEILEGLEGVSEAFFQVPTNTLLNYPAIVYQRDDSSVSFADNITYLLRKRYQVIVVDRNPDSLIPDMVERLPHSRFDRFYVADGLNHFVFNLYF